MSEASVKAVKSRLIPEADKLETQANTIGGVRENLTDYAARQADIGQRLGEIAAELAEVQRNIGEAAGIYESVQGEVDSSRGIIADAGEDSPQLTSAASILGGAVQSMSRSHAHMTTIYSTLGDQAAAVLAMSEALRNQAGTTSAVGSESEQVTAAVTSAVSEVRNWVAVS